MEFESRYVDTGEVRLHYKEAGSGKPVILLHGFPEAWYSWRHQIPALAAAGHRVIAPDLRGYNLSGRPRETEMYGMNHLVADVEALIRHVGGPVTLVGHDWGGIVAWFTAMKHPDLLDRLIVLNAPFPVCYMRELRHTIEQKLRALYQIYLQAPLIPEITLPFLLPPFMRQAGRFTREDIETYKTIWRQPGAIRAMANYYRALRRSMAKLGHDVRTIALPSMLIWGDREVAFSKRTLDGTREWVPHLRLEVIRNAGHFVQTDASAKVNELMIDFLES